MRLQSILIAAIAIAAALALAAASGQSVPPSEARIDGRPLQIPTDGYVSSDTCRACHPAQYSSWRRSYHRTMTQIATPGTVRASFDGAIVNDVPGKPMRLERRGSDLWAEFDDPDAGDVGGQRPRVTRQIVMVTGSHQQQVYWYRTDRQRLLGQLPAMYLIADRRWVPRRSAFLTPPSDHAVSETGRWNAVCVSCHTTDAQPDFDAAGRIHTAAATGDARAAEFGIACEACHGPAADHVKANRNPLRRYSLHLSSSRDASIVLPTALDVTRSSQVCGQCHSVWKYFDSVAAGVESASSARFTPGADLTHVRFVLQPGSSRDRSRVAQALATDPDLADESFWPDGMIRVSGREYNGLIASPCVTGATDPTRTLTCFSCHAMHQPPGDQRPLAQWATHQLATERDGNEACLQCHRTIAGDVGGHTKHQPASSGSSCYNCHMPYTTYGLLRALRSHQISSPSAQVSVETGRPNACNLCHLDKTLRWTADALREWYGIAPPVLDANAQNVAASLSWLLSGDAGQRALVAWSMGWAPAQQASGTGWMVPFLAGSLDDPYDAVRYIAERSLRSLPGTTGFSYDFVAPQAARQAAVVSVMNGWRRTSARLPERGRPELLLNADGDLLEPALLRLVALRDGRRVSLRE